MTSQTVVASKNTKAILPLLQDDFFDDQEFMDDKFMIQNQRSEGQTYSNMLPDLNVNEYRQLGQYSDQVSYYRNFRNSHVGDVISGPDINFRRKQKNFGIEAFTGSDEKRTKLAHQYQPRPPNNYYRDPNNHYNNFEVPKGNRIQSNHHNFNTNTHQSWNREANSQTPQLQFEQGKSFDSLRAILSKTNNIHHKHLNIRINMPQVVDDNWENWANSAEQNTNYGFQPRVNM